MSMTKEKFTANIGDWDNHRLLLWEALESTKHFKLPVLELGCGNGSTPYLQEYCKDNGLELYSYDYNFEWAEKFGATHVTNWDSQVPWRKEWGVVLVDESPGEHRKQSIVLCEHAKAIVVHDSEPVGWNASDYQVRPLFLRFQHTFDLQSEKLAGAWATYLSDTIPFRGL